MSGIRQRVHHDYETISKESSIWDTYNNMADVRDDDEMMQDWRESLNSLLLFVSLSLKEIWSSDPIQAAIFVAVLTAFIIESKNLLQ